MRILYKVVQVLEGIRISVVVPLMSYIPAVGDLCTHYPPRTLVWAPRDSLGLFCFETLHEAEWFIAVGLSSDFTKNDVRIIRVMVPEEAVLGTPVIISSWTHSLTQLQKFYAKNMHLLPDDVDWDVVRGTPRGTICVNELYTLE